MFLVEKETKEKLSDGHLWISVFTRPPLSTFTRKDRVTCGFVILYLVMLMNIIYFDKDTSKSAGLQLGPFTISVSEILIGVLCTLITLPPTLLIVQLFRRSRRRETRSVKLKKLMTKSSTAADVKDR